MKNKLKMKVGDLAIVIGDETEGIGSHQFKMGEIVEIIRTFDYYYHCSNKTDWWAMMDSELHQITL